MNGFPLPNGGQNIGDHVAPFLSLLSLATDPTNSCNGLWCHPMNPNGICVDLNKVGNLHHCIDMQLVEFLIAPPPRNLIFYWLVRGGGSFMWIYFCQSHLELWLSSISFGLSLWIETQNGIISTHVCVHWTHCEVLNTFEYLSYSCFNFVACPPKKGYILTNMANHECQVVNFTLFGAQVTIYTLCVACQFFA